MPHAVPDIETHRLWEEFSDRLFGFIKANIRDREAAEDILHDVFEKIHLKKSSLKNSDKLVSWLFQLTRNTIFDYYRSKKQEATQPVFDDLEMDSEEQELDALACCIDPFISKLTEQEQLLIRKIDIEGQRQNNLAKSWGISYTSLKSKVQRARKKLKAMFIDCCALTFDKRGGVLSQGSSNCQNC